MCDKTRLWLLRVPTDAKADKNYMAFCIKRIIAPAARAIQEEVLAGNRRIREQARQASAPGQRSEDAPAPEKRVEIILTFDGEYAFLQAIDDAMSDPSSPFSQIPELHMLKYAAAASKTQQPCDVASSFMVAKSEISKKDAVAVVPRYAPNISGIYLKGVTGQSLATYSSFLLRIQAAIGTAFTQRHIADGWGVAGIFPLSVETIMRRCTTWAQLNSEQSDAIMRAIPLLAVKAAQHGELFDDAMQVAVGSCINFDAWMEMQSGQRAKAGRPLAELVINRRRTIWLNNEGFLAHRRAVEEKKQSKKAEEAVARATKSAKKQQQAQKREEKKKEKEAKNAAKIAAAKPSKVLNISTMLICFQSKKKKAVNTPKPEDEASEAPQ